MPAAQAIAPSFHHYPELSEWTEDGVDYVVTTGSYGGRTAQTLTLPTPEMHQRLIASINIENRNTKMDSNKLQIFASLLSSLATPIAIAIGGWWIQSSVSQNGLRKDYVQIAVNILNTPDKDNKNADLRKWAVNIIDQHAPVPLSQASKDRLAEGRNLFIQFPKELAEECPDLEELTGKTGKDVLLWSLDVINKYQDCKLRHHYTIEVIKAVESTAITTDSP